MATSIWEHFSILPDPRVERTKLHKLEDILTIAICAMICGAETWVDIADFGRAKEAWLRTFLELPHGIPSHDTFGRLFAILDPRGFERCFQSWIATLAGSSAAKLIAIDGKTIRRSLDRASGKAAIHMVTAWVHENHAAFGQLRTEDKSNEITAIPQLLEMLNLEAATVTIDAIGCQKDIAQKVLDKDGQYVLAVKSNQETLYEDIRLFLDDAVENDFRGIEHDLYEQTEKGHGRIEMRRCWTTGQTQWLHQRHDWPGLQSIAAVDCRREISGKISTERRYFISSLPGRTAQRIAVAVRNHWCVENELHWSLDVCFGEDQSRVRIGNAAENLSRVRRFALTLLKQETTGNIDLATEDGSRVVQLNGNSAGSERALAFNGITNPIDDDEAGILFFRFRFRDSSRSVRTFMALISDVSNNPTNGTSADDPLSMPLAVRWAGNPGEGLSVLTTNGATILKSGLARGQWYNIWLVADNANDVFELYISAADGPSGAATLPTEADFVASLPFVTATTDSLNGMMISNPSGTGQAERISVDEFYWDGDQGLRPPTKAHNPKPVNMAEGVLVDGARLSWNTGTEPNDPNVPNPNIIAHYLWISAPYYPVNPVIPERWWREPGAQQFTIGADTAPADGQVDPNVVIDIPGLQRDKLYLWVVDEGLVGASGPEEADPSKIIWGNVWRFETETSGLMADAGLNILTWLDETTGKATVTPDANVFDPSGDLASILWSFNSPPDDPNVTISNPTVEDPTVEMTVTGTFTLSVVATDLAGNPPGEDTMEIRVFANSCEAAQNNPNGYNAPQGDLNGDCIVDFLDFVMFATDWADDTRLITAETYE